MSFLYPEIFWIILIPVIVLFVLIITNKSSISRVFDSSVLERLSIKNNTFSTKERNILLFITLVLVVIAMARPVLPKEEQKVEQNVRSFVFVWDISKSMLASDNYPNRALMAKKKMITLLDHLDNVKVGVIVFASNSFILSPLTADKNILKYMINQVDIEAFSSGGTNLVGVIDSTSTLLRDEVQKEVIFFSDGGDKKEFEDELDILNKNGIKLHFVGLGTKEGSAIKTQNGLMKDKDGNIVIVKYNEAMEKLANESGGLAIKATVSDKDMKLLVQALNEQKTKKAKVQRVKQYEELFYYPLSLALLFLLFATSSLPKRSNKIFSLLALTFIIDSTNLYAGILDFKSIEEANKAYGKEDYLKAKNHFYDVSKSKKSNESFYNLANSYYKNQDYKKAIENYEKVVTTDKKLEHKKLYNMANSHVKIGDIPKAIELYEKVIKRFDDEDAKYNLELLKQQQKQQKGKDKNQENKNDKGDKKKDNKQEKNKKDGTEEKGQEKNSKKSEQKDNKQNSSSKPQKEMSDIEEKKWLKNLDKNMDKGKVLMFKMPNRVGESGESAW